jgi:hypothetical protein
MVNVFVVAILVGVVPLGLGDDGQRSEGAFAFVGIDS